MGRGTDAFEEEGLHPVDTDTLPVAVGNSCYERCRKLSGKLMDLFKTAEDRQTDELALICEGKRMFRPCGAVVVRTSEVCSVVAGPYFGMGNAEELTLYEAAQSQNEVHGLEVAFAKTKK